MTIDESTIRRSITEAGIGNCVVWMGVASTVVSREIMDNAVIDGNATFVSVKVVATWQLRVNCPRKEKGFS